MDAFEPVRNSAAGLHDEAVAAGADPQSPILLVEAAIRLLDLELFWLQPGDPALKGALALFDEQSGTVCCESGGHSSERALLVAHEIAHSRVHVGSSCCSAADIDPSLSSESTPIGLQRVEDYGVRERRELQANVFAREFVLPRPLARRLYLDEGMDAARIADRTGLPNNLVRQQLFDALLLPSVAASQALGPNSQKPLRPDPSQDRAANHRGSAFQLQAGPGTGKTRTMVKCVLSLLAEGIHPSAILILTFSNRAAGELAERIDAAAPGDAERIWIGTFHAFGLDLLRRYHDRLGLPAKPALFDKSDAIEVLEEILPTLPLVHYRSLWDPAMVLRDVVAAISRAKDELADPEHYRSLADAMLRQAVGDDQRVAAEKCLEVAQIYDLYEQTLRAHGAIDFGDLVMRPTLLLESDAALREAVQLRHRHVLVDEYQDVNRASTRLLKAISGDGKRLWVVGDARQSIYRFRGASSANMAAFVREYPDATVDQLSINYRSTKQIVDAVVAIAPRMGASEGLLPLALEPDRAEDTGRVEIRRYDTLDDEAEGLAASIREFEASHVRLLDQVILCRSNGRLDEIAAALEARGIPVLHLGCLFEREEVRDLLALLSLSVEPFGDGLARVGAMPRYDIPLQDVYAATQWSRAAGRPFLATLPDIARIPGLSEQGAFGLARLANDLEGLARETSGWEFLSTYLLDRTDLAREMAQRQSIQDRMRAIAIWQFLNFVREQSPTRAGLPIRRILDRVRQLVLLAEERELRQVPAAAQHMDAVRLMTVHGSKGLEFEAVHVPGLTTACFPSSYRGDRCPPPLGMIAGAEGLSASDAAKRFHEQEEQCLFFVAVSRARTHLCLHLARLQPNGNKRSPSAFLPWIPPHLVVDVARPATLSLPVAAPGPAPLVVTRPAGWHLTDSQLKSYEQCPRRYFYTHVLGLGGARRATAFSRTHDCLYDLIRWLSEARHDGPPSIEAAEAAFEVIWQARGPVDHGFAPHYRRLASQLVAALVRSCEGRRFRDVEPLAIDFPSGRVVVDLNDFAELSGGVVALRRVRTGHKRTNEYDRLEYALCHLAGKARFGEHFILEAHHLSGDKEEVVPITARKLASSGDKGEALLKALTTGWFPTKSDPVICPRCPHYFICAATPGGSMRLPEKI